MSVTDKRALLATRLSSIAGVRGYEFRPATIKVGTAWPLLQNLERGPGVFFAGNWRIVLALGGDEKTAQKKLDELLPLIVKGLEPEAFVESANPAILQTDKGDMFAAEIHVRSE